MWLRSDEGRLTQTALRPYVTAGWLTPPEVATLRPIGRRRVAPGVDARIRNWLAHRATSDERRILTSLIHRPDAIVAKRVVQQRLHRVAAGRLNRALNGFVAAGLVARECGWLTLPAEVLEASRVAA